MYLNCKTFFSFRYGVLSSQQLVQQAVEQGAQALALTNINSTSDHWDFRDDCLNAGIKPILGAEIRNDSVCLYILLARDMKGILAINNFISHHLQNKVPFPP